MPKEILDLKQLKIVFAKLLASKKAWIPFTEYVWKFPITEDYFDHKNDLNILFKEDPDNWIYFAFVWANTKESEPFWNELNDRWQDILKYNIDYE